MTAKDFRFAFIAQFRTIPNFMISNSGHASSRIPTLQVIKDVLGPNMLWTRFTSGFLLQQVSDPLNVSASILYQQLERRYCDRSDRPCTEQTPETCYNSTTSSWGWVPTVINMCLSSRMNIWPMGVLCIPGTATGNIPNGTIDWDAVFEVPSEFIADP